MASKSTLMLLVASCIILGCVSPGTESPTTTYPTFTTTTLAPVNCTELQDEINSNINSMNFCSTDNECGLTTFPCPFGCRIYNKMNETESLDLKVNQYNQRCGYCSNQCSYYGGDLLCDSSKCAQSLMKLDLDAGAHNYHANDTIAITLKNMLNRTIYLQKCDDFQLQLRAEGRWNTVAGNCSQEFIKIGPTSEYRYALSDYNLSQDRYRATANVWVKCLEYPKSSLDCRKNLTLTSGEFRIKP